MESHHGVQLEDQPRPSVVCRSCVVRPNPCLSSAATPPSSVGQADTASRGDRSVSATDPDPATPPSHFDTSEIGEAVLVCTRDGRVLWSSPDARTLPKDCCTVRADGLVMFRQDHVRIAFLAALSAVAGTATPRRLPVPRPNQLPYRLELRAAAGLTVAVTITDLEIRHRALVEAARIDYKLTPSECALADSLMRGRTPDEHAVLRSTSMSTVRTQLKTLLEKTGTRRQAELVALLSR